MASLPLSSLYGAFLYTLALLYIRMPRPVYNRKITVFQGETVNFWFQVISNIIATVFISRNTLVFSKDNI